MLFKDLSLGTTLMEYLVSGGMSEGTLPFSLKIFDKKVWPISTFGECTKCWLHLILIKLHLALTSVLWFKSLQGSFTLLNFEFVSLLLTMSETKPQAFTGEELLSFLRSEVVKKVQEKDDEIKRLKGR